jgi:hypothetical protein
VGHIPAIEAVDMPTFALDINLATSIFRGGTTPLRAPLVSGHTFNELIHQPAIHSLYQSFRNESGGRGEIDRFWAALAVRTNSRTSTEDCTVRINLGSERSSPAVVANLMATTNGMQRLRIRVAANCTNTLNISDGVFHGTRNS